MALFKVANKDYELEDLFKDIYNNSIDRKIKLEQTLDTIKPFVTDVRSALQLLPEITKLQQVSVNNDDHLLKLASIAMKSLNPKASKTETDEFGISDEERKELLALAKAAAEQNIPGNSKG